MKNEHIIDTLNEGEKVLFFPKGVNSKPREVKVERVTPQRVLVGGVYFDRKKGYACGHSYDAYPPAILQPKQISAEKEEAIPVHEDVPAITTREKPLVEIIESKIAEVQDLLNQFAEMTAK